MVGRHFAVNKSTAPDHFGHCTFPPVVLYVIVSGNSAPLMNVIDPAAAGQ
jgi:hypothetical protein